MSVFNIPKPTERAARNGFDRSKYATFTTKVGKILHVKSIPTLPYSEYKVDLAQLLRTINPMQTAAFTGFSINYDIIWTPNHSSYTAFNQFIAQRSSKQTVTSPSFERIPLFDANKFTYLVLKHALWDYIWSYTDGVVFAQDSVYYTIPRRLVVSAHSSETSIFLDVIRHLDMFGYGNYLPVLKKMYSVLMADIGVVMNYQGWTNYFKENGVLVQSDVNQPYYFNNYAYNTWFDSIYNDDVNGLWYAHFQESLVAHFTAVNKVSLWPVLAYNRSFYEFYRNEYYDNEYIVSYPDGNGILDSYSVPYVQLFNLDDFQSSWTLDDSDVIDSGWHSTWFGRLVCMFAVKPHQYKRDMFTAVLPSTQFGDVSVMVEQDLWRKILPNSLSSPYTQLASTDVLDHLAGLSSSSTTKVGGDFVGVSPNASNRFVSFDKFKFDPAIAISVLESRRADAMQRFKERMLRAGDKIKDIFKAHGWTEPKSEQSLDPLFLGSYDGRLDINTVAATSESENYDVAQLGANGVGVVRGQTINFKSSDFGELSILFHIDKEAVYDSFGIDKQHLLTTPFDFPYPELQNISLVPIEYKALTYDDSRGYGGNDIIGYLPSHIVYKTDIDTVHGECFTDDPLVDGSAIIESASRGVFANWVSARHDLVSVKDLSFLYIHPSCADDIFTEYANDRQESDQFIINLRIECFAVQPLSVIGLPI